MTKTNDSLKRFDIDGWVLRAVPDAMPERWVPRLGEFELANGVKSNARRAVFVVPAAAAGRNLYVKLERPRGFLGRLRAALKCNARLEYRSHELLAGAGIPTVRYLGWGRRGGEGIIFSEEQSGCLNARTYWFRNFSDECSKWRYLSSLAAFIKKFLASPLSHPDFHLGNLLYNEASSEFVMVDVYGVSKSRGGSEGRAFAVARILGALRGELSDEEAAGVILDSGLASGRVPALELWLRIAAAEDAEMEGLWPKRRAQILSGHPKYCATVRMDDAEWLIRLDMSGRPLADESDVRLGNLGRYRREDMSRESAEEAWLDAHKKEFLRRPLADAPVMWARSTLGSAPDRIYTPKV